MNRKILITGASFGLIAVLLGAFGAHGLQKVVDEAAVASFTTGVRYQMYHALLLLFLGTNQVLSEKIKKNAFYFFLVGVLLFSGSIYALVLDEVIGTDFSAIAPITPIGGLLLIIGWALLLIGFLKTIIHIFFGWDEQNSMF